MTSSATRSSERATNNTPSQTRHDSFCFTKVVGPYGPSCASSFHPTLAWCHGTVARTNIPQEVHLRSSVHRGDWVRSIHNRVRTSCSDATTNADTSSLSRALGALRDRPAGAREYNGDHTHAPRRHSTSVQNSTASRKKQQLLTFAVLQPNWNIRSNVISRRVAPCSTWSSHSFSSHFPVPILGILIARPSPDVYEHTQWCATTRASSEPNLWYRKHLSMGEAPARRERSLQQPVVSAGWTTE